MPTVLESATSKFDFPQGTSPTDVVIEGIYEKYGVKLIYKAFTQSDVDRGWKSPQGDSFIDLSCAWSYLDEATQLETAVGILKEKVFDLLPEAVITSALRACPYLYVVDNIHYAQGSRMQMPVYPVKALDSWMVNLSLGYQQPDNYSMRVFYPARIMCEMFAYAFAGGAITMPSEFFEGLNVDVLTLKKYDDAARAGAGSPDYNNYWARRGFSPAVSPDHGRIFTGKSQKSCSITPTVMPPLTEATREVAQFFLFLCLDIHWRDYFAPGHIFEDCPRLSARLNLFNDRMKDVYGIDFDAIRDKLYDGSTMDTSPIRYAAETDSKDGSFNNTFIYANY
jgi:hypothetical protein